MPSKKKKYNARFPAGRIKKIMQTDEEVGKVAQAVPVIISRTLELFVESLLKKTVEITNAKNAKTLTPSHMKQCILSESRFDFLADLVKNIPDAVNEEDPLSNEVPFSNSGVNRRRTSVETSQFNSKPNSASYRSCPSSSNSNTSLSHVSHASQQPYVSSSTPAGGLFEVSQGVVPIPQHASPSAPFVHISYPHMFPSTESQGVPQVSSTPGAGFQVNLCPTPSINTFNQMVPSYTPTSAGYSSPNLVIDEDYDN